MLNYYKKMCVVGIKKTVSEHTVSIFSIFVAKMNLSV